MRGFLLTLNLADPDPQLDVLVWAKKSKVMPSKQLDDPSNLMS